MRSIRRGSTPSSTPSDCETGSSTGPLGFLRRAVDDFGQTVVMVTHDAVAASQADRVVFLADGQIADEMTEPTTARILDRMKRFGP